MSLSIDPKAMAFTLREARAAMRISAALGGRFAGPEVSAPRRPRKAA